MVKIMGFLCNINKHTMFCGPTGTGKSINVFNDLKQNYQTEETTFINLAFSAQTTANQTQKIIDG
jgi:dynein heavy chain